MELRQRPRNPKLICLYHSHREDHTQLQLQKLKLFQKRHLRRNNQANQLIVEFNPTQFHLTRANSESYYKLNHTVVDLLTYLQIKFTTNLKK